MSELCRFIHAEKANYPIVLLCRALHVARSSYYYAWRDGEAARPKRQAADDALAHEITVLHIASRKTYGVPRIHAGLRRLGQRVNRKRIARIMRQRDIRGATRRKHRSLTRPDKKAKPAPDLIGRDFHAERPGIKLVGDITYLPTAEGWLYLACWLDLATREVVGYAMADHHRAELVIDALDMAHGRSGLEPDCVIHSDRGSEYTSAQFRDRIRELGLRQSCGRTGSCFDNAAAESFWALLKEEIGTRTWPDRGHRPRRGLQLHRDLLQPPPPTQAQDLRLPHPGRDQAAPATRPRGVTITCPRSWGNFQGRVVGVFAGHARGSGSV
ncbi:IS3 family transposase [Streptomyces sp. NBC_01217]|uniref:IS3 family transposase n=1 Tax=Streptomyces sp. NBC_01217 TaxID=2903779 RepID=UPI002E0E701C|nr:IS3 family transposase [Streptomyces sp. NBC_01217]WSQ62526.1 IS3 family transposase [Streptomyces sp. NBC_01217]